MSTLTNRVEGFSVSHAQILTEGQSFLQALGQAAALGEDIYGVAEAGLSPDLGSYDNEGDDAIMSTWDWINKAELTVKAGYVSFPLLSSITGRPVDTIASSAATNEVQTVTSTATGGTFTVSHGGGTTGPLAVTITAADLGTAIRALPGIGAGNLTAAGGPLNTAPVTLTYGGALAGVNAATLVIDDTSATGGDVTVATTTGGSPGNKAGFGIDLWHEDSVVSQPRPMIIKMPSKDENGVPADFVIGLYKVQFKPITFDGPAYRDGLKINYDGNGLQSAVDELGNPFPDGKKRFGRLLAIQR